VAVKNALFRLIGKTDRKVLAVFGISPVISHRAVVHVRAGAAGIRVWLFSTIPPDAETAALCDQVHVNRNPLALVIDAQRRLWPEQVALVVAPWTGERCNRALKAAPFLIPPFRVLIANDHGDFFAATPAAMAIHNWRRVTDATRRLTITARLAWERGRDLPRRGWVRARDIVRARLLAASAWVLRAFGYPHYQWFEHLHGSERLEPQVNSEGRTGAIEYVQRGPDWDGVAIGGLAESTSARWLVWRRGPSAESVDDLLGLFSDEHTFAVSRQKHFRGWKIGMVPTAPFRTLQSGEACRVLAPLSDTIVVDLRKLVALGIPDRGLAGTVWLELFWKAAAAGWFCYSVGQSLALQPEPERPIESAQFFWRTRRDRKLSRLGPCKPDLTRGNLSFAPAFNRGPEPRRDRLRVLLVSPFLPYPLSHGGAVRIYNLCRELAGRVDFILAAVRERLDVVDYAKLHEIFREVHVVDRDELPSGEQWLPTQVQQYRSRALHGLIGELASKWKPDLMQIEYTHMAGFRSSAPQIPAVLVEHDLTFTLYRQLAAIDPGDETRRQFERWQRFERHWLTMFDAVWTVSEEDRMLAVREGSQEESTFAVPNGVDLTRFRPHPEPADTQELLYVGSFRHLPNIIGFEKLRSEVMPRVWEEYPNLRLRVVAGPDYEKFWRDLCGRNRGTNGAGAEDPRIVIQGFVEDVAPLYADATAVVVPLEVSAGTNIKVLEAMACGKPIVTTPVGCAGLGLTDRHEALIRKDWTGFAMAVCQLLATAELRRRLGANARRTAEQAFGWNAIAETAIESYRAVTRPTPEVKRSAAAD
jgi:glycosyltransferase involved in cell wall biosynthesis